LKEKFELCLRIGGVALPFGKRNSLELLDVALSFDCEFSLLISFEDEEPAGHGEGDGGSPLAFLLS